MDMDTILEELIGIREWVDNCIKEAMEEEENVEKQAVTFSR